jgi:hypothetical protein
MEPGGGAPAGEEDYCREASFGSIMKSVWSLFQFLMGCFRRQRLKTFSSQTRRSHIIPEMNQTRLRIPNLIGDMLHRQKSLQSCLDKRDIFDELIGLNCGSERFAYDIAKNKVDHTIDVIRTMNEIITMQLKLNRSSFRSCN